MRIAVLLYGHVRTYEQCVDFFHKNVTEVNFCDVFMHTWDTIDHNTKSWYGQLETKTLFDETTVNRLKELYAPKDIMIEHQKEEIDTQEFSLLEKPHSLVRTVTAHFLFYSMGQANELRKLYERNNSFSYDLILVTRPDIQFRSPLDLASIVRQAKISNIDLSKARFVAYTHTSNRHNQKLLINRVNDLLFFAKPEVVDRYIKANQDISYEFMRDHALNYPSVFTAAELSVGIMPFHISYCYKDDWENIQTEERKKVMEQSIANIETPKLPLGEIESTKKKFNNDIFHLNVKSGLFLSTLKKIIKPIAKVIFYPLKRFYIWSRIHFRWLTEN